jgi:DDE family transposase
LPIRIRLESGSGRKTVVTRRHLTEEITISTSQGRRTGAYRLVTTLTGSHARPAAELIRLYHERWEVETSCLEIKSTLLGGRVLRARTPAGVAQ